ncbi:DUF4349 domain-containing protein [Micromonospora sp. NPDC050417]|uniref:DUF4349 domain-containing protein n=1 Tax=Micromonospora sp. NPDC050417 TaxID=3364280 RepID=UPI003794C2CE
MARGRWVGFLGAAGMVAVLTVAGCSATASDNSTSGAGEAVAPAAAPAEKADAAAAGDFAGQSQADTKPGELSAAGAQTPANLRVDQRSIIYTGSMTVRVKEIERAATEAVAIATGAGGFVGGDQRSSSTGDAEASLQLRVPADRFASVVDALAKLGRQEQREIKTQDVTEETLDLAARIQTQQARVESGRRLLAQAKTLSDLVMLEGELAKREADLVALEARQRRLGDLTALSTITVRLIGPEAVVVEDEQEKEGFLAGLRGGWHALLATLGVVLIVLGALLPWAVALGVPALLVFWLTRRHRRRAGGPPASPVTVASGQSAPPAPTPPAPRTAEESAEARRERP